MANTGGNKKKSTIIWLVLIGILLIGSLVGWYVVTQQKTQVQNRAATGPVCPANGATCSWEAGDTQPGETPVTSYSYAIYNKTKGYVVKQGTTTSTSVSFTPVVGNTYKCVVKAINSCGTGPSTSAENMCSAQPTNTPTPTETLTPTPTVNPACGNTCTANTECPSDHTCSAGKCVLSKCLETGTQCDENKCSVLVPTETPTPTNTPTPTPTVNPACGNTCTANTECPSDHTCSAGKCVLSKCLETGTQCTTNKCSVIAPTATNTPTPTNTPTATPTNTPGPTNTPAATNTPGPSSTPGPSATPTEIVIAQNQPTTAPTTAAVAVATNTPTVEPTIPSAGSTSGYYFIVAATVILGALLFVF